jgi:hypothetical protein
MRDLGWSLDHEDLAEGKRSLQKLTAFKFDVACFGHGKGMGHGAVGKFKQKWALPRSPRFSAILHGAFYPLKVAQDS